MRAPDPHKEDFPMIPMTTQQDIATLYNVVTSLLRAEESAA